MYATRLPPNYYFSAVISSFLHVPVITARLWLSIVLLTVHHLVLLCTHRTHFVLVIHARTSIVHIIKSSALILHALCPTTSIVLVLSARTSFVLITQPSALFIPASHHCNKPSYWSYPSYLSSILVIAFVQAHTSFVLVVGLPYEHTSFCKQQTRFFVHVVRPHHHPHQATAIASYSCVAVIPHT